jgi:glutamine amidotransferase
MKNKVAIIDFELSNLYSVQHACNHVGLDAVITSNISEILNKDAIILPGVGAFGDAMANLIKLNLVDTIKEFVASGKPFMGICLGFQLLFSESEEFGIYKGLGLVDGKVKKFPNINYKGELIRVPQIGWNRIINNSINGSWENSLLKDIPDKEYMYFVHSLYGYRILFKHLYRKYFCLPISS